MGAVLAIAGVGSASISKKLDKALYWDGDRGCNGKKSKSFTKARIKDCKQVSYAQAKLRPQKYPQGAGTYVGDRKLPNCYIPNSCRQDCDYFDRVWKGVKRQITHLNKEGLIRRLVGEPCVWKSSGSSCEGVPCRFYRQQATRHYRDFASAEEARWAKIIDKFSKSPLGKFLSVVPVVGSELDILYKDIKGERPDASDWVSFATDVAFAMVPGGSAVSAGAKAAVKAIAKTGFKQMVKTGAVRSTAKTMIRKVFANPLIQQELRHIAMKAALKQSIKGLGRALTSAEEKQVKTVIYELMDNRNEKMMEALLKQTFVIPEKYYAKKVKYEKDVESGKRKAVESDTRRKCLYVKGKKEKGCWGQYIYRRRLKDGSYTKWGVTPTSADTAREARKEEKAVMGTKDAGELQKLRERARKDKLIAIANLQRVQREQDAERLKDVPDARLKLKN